MISFIRRHIDQILQEGSTAVFRKIRIVLQIIPKIIVQSPFFLAAIPVIVIIRFLRPLVIIRFGQLRSDRIGHFAGNTVLQLCERDVGMHGKNTYDIFYILPPVSNEQLKKMWERTMNIFPFAYPLSLANRCFPGSSKRIVKHALATSDLDKGNVIEILKKTHVHVSFTPEEERLGEQGLQEMGVSKNTPFVSFIGRDSSYLDSTQAHVSKNPKH